MTLIIFLFIIALLVFVHELGHFLMARRAGAKVEEFGLGFPPRLFSLKKGETIYSINFIPLGGFVKIYGEDGGDINDPKSFASKTISQRFKIILAGVTMNLFLAVGLLTLGYNLGLPTAMESGGPNTNVQITQVAYSSPAELAGLKIGDTILQFNDVSGFQEFINQHQGESVELTIQRGSEILSLSLTPRKNPPVGQGAIGVALANVALVSYPWYESIFRAVTSIIGWVITIFVLLGALIWNLFVQGQAPIALSDVSGPVGIFSLMGQMHKLGFIYLLQLTTLLSVNLAVINALPFPALDGGRLIFLLIEKIKGSPISQDLERKIHTAGFVFLILLMIMITFKDITKLF